MSRDLRDYADGGIERALDELGDADLQRAFLAGLHESLSSVERLVRDVRRDHFAAVRRLTRPSDLTPA